MRNIDPECHGTREELVTELRRLAVGWFHLANDRLAEEAQQAVTALGEGASSVRVGHTRYVVTE